MSELKPCPFSNQPAKCYTQCQRHCDDSHKVECAVKGCPCSAESYSTPDEANSAWNKRPSLWNPNLEEMKTANGYLLLSTKSGMMMTGTRYTGSDLQDPITAWMPFPKPYNPPQQTNPYDNLKTS